MEKRKERVRLSRPNLLLYVILCGLASLYARFIKRQRLHNNLPNDLKPPYIIVGNHSSFFDFIYAMRAVYPHRINFVAARKYFHFAGLRILLKLGKAIPKSLYEADFSTVATMFDILRKGGIVGIYPEGQIAMYGVSIDNGNTIGKFVKKAGVPVVRVKTGGAFFANPPWGGPERKGFVDSFVDLVLTAKQVKEASVHDISEAVRESIFMDNYQWQKESGAIFTGKNLAKGLENMLYRCPQCQSEFTLYTEGNSILCSHCGMTAYCSTDGRLHFGGNNYFHHIGDWHQWELSCENATIDMGYQISEPVILAMLRPSGKGIEEVGQGTFTVNEMGYTYEGYLRGEQVKLQFFVAHLHFFPFDPGSNFQIYHQNELYEFRPENKMWCCKIANICECLYKKANAPSFPESEII